MEENKSHVFSFQNSKKKKFWKRKKKGCAHFFLFRSFAKRVSILYRLFEYSVFPTDGSRYTCVRRYRSAASPPVRCISMTTNGLDKDFRAPHKQTKRHYGKRVLSWDCQASLLASPSTSTRFPDRQWERVGVFPADSVGASH